MIKAVVKPQNQNLSIKLPKSFIGKNVQLIAYTVKESKNDVDTSNTPLTHFASELVLAKDWLTAEEDKAWQDL